MMLCTVIADDVHCNDAFPSEQRSEESDKQDRTVNVSQCYSASSNKSFRGFGMLGMDKNKAGLDH